AKGASAIHGRAFVESRPAAGVRGCRRCPGDRHLPRAHLADTSIAGGIARLIPFRCCVWALFALGVSANGAQIRFTYENPKLQPPKYFLTVEEDGSGHFTSEGGGPTDGTTMSSEPQDRPIHISKALREAMFTTARKNKLFAISCDDGGKNIAFQGNKTL